jgi:hypothetical protein
MNPDQAHTYALEHREPDHGTATDLTIEHPRGRGVGPRAGLLP